MVGAYARLANIYDLVFGRTLAAGRAMAFEGIPLDGANVLEVGVGTGLSLPNYPRTCAVTGIDLSPPMLERASRRLAALGADNITLLQMDAGEMQFADETFDVVSAAYVVSTVENPRRVLSEMRRVCRKGGHIVLLNHFLSTNPAAASLERLLTRVSVYAGFRTDLDLEGLLTDSGLTRISTSKVNQPPLWSRVVCRR